MLRYLLLCVLLTMGVISANCYSQWFQCEDSTSPALLIQRTQLCDGVRHCRDGSDESIRNCKYHRNTEVASDLFFCVSGAMIPFDNVCNNITDCADGSDEMGCEDIDPNIYRGNCGESMVKCKRESKCIEIAKLCDKKYDCNDGWDESLPMCFTNCLPGQFQCGNGACIEGSLVCDSKLDCLDGADELPNVCLIIPDDTPMPSINCTLPKNKFVRNLEDTSPHIRGAEKYYLPHEVVHLRCPTYRLSQGSDWNICNTTGQWQFPMLECIRRRRKDA